MKPRTMLVLNGNSRVGEAKVETMASVMVERDRLRELLRAYVEDETRFLKGEGEPFGSIDTETGAAARQAIKA